MRDITHVGCRCGSTRVELRGETFLVTECLCNSCREAAARLATLPGANCILTSYAATACANYRKDRIRVIAGAEHLKEFRLSGDAGTRRIVAACCNTPVFLELKGGHWLGVFVNLWPDETRPKADLRTMVGDLSDTSRLPDDIPNLKTHSLSFYMKLFGAWLGMGFRNPKIEVAGKINA